MASKSYYSGRIKPEMLEGTRLSPGSRGQVCVVIDCTNPARNYRSWYCEDHDAERYGASVKAATKKADEAPRKKVERIESISEGTAPPPAAAKGAPDEKKLGEWLAMVLVILTYVVGLRAAGGQGLLMRGADKELATRLAMTDAQADNIARVAAKKLAPTRFYKRAGAQVVEVLDMEVVAAVESMWEWASSIGPYLRQHHEPVTVTTVPTSAPYQNGRSPNGSQPPVATALGQRAVPLHRIDD